MTKIKKAWLTTVGLLVASGIALSQSAGDRAIKNPTQDKDIIFQVNKGGTIVDAFKVFGASGVASPTIKANVRSSEGAGTTTLTIADAPHQIFNLSAARTTVLPTTGVKVGYEVTLENRGAFDLTVNASGGSAINITNSSNADSTINKGKVVLVALQDAPTTPAHWRVTSLYEEGSFATDGALSGTMKFYRTGNLLTLQLQATHSAAGSAVSNTGNVPTRLRPSTCFNNIVVITGGPSYADRIEVCSNGQISVAHYLLDGGGFSSVSGISGFLTYALN